MPTFFDGFTDLQSVNDTYPLAQITPEEIVYAGYIVEDYTGYSLVVWVRDGQWFENNDSHCSCNELGIWLPEMTLPDALLIRQGWPGLSDAVRERTA